MDLLPAKTLHPDKSWKVYNRAMSRFTKGSKDILRLDDRPGEGLAWLPNIQAGNGSIEFDVKGKNVLQKSFVGIAFHGVDNKTYDAIYFRPFNFNSEDSVRRGHALQYISIPDHGWKTLRDQQPGEYEHPLNTPADPDSWFHAKIVLDYPKVSVFVNDSKTPCLVVKQLNDRKKGRVGFWVGDGSDGEFANLRVSAEKQAGQ